MAPEILTKEMLIHLKMLLCTHHLMCTRFGDFQVKIWELAIKTLQDLVYLGMNYASWMNLRQDKTLIASHSWAKKSYFLKLLGSSECAILKTKYCEVTS